jgi:hypothetical protein
VESQLLLNVDLHTLLLLRMDEGPGQNIFPIMAASYASLSFIFFLFPALLRRSRPLPSKLLRIAHRGGARLYPENTLLAFRKSAPFSDML